MGILTFVRFIMSCEVASLSLFPWKGIGKVKAPQRVFFFVWTATWDKIFMSDNMTSKLGQGVHECGLWRGIHMGWETFSKNTRFEIGVGNRVKFWQDWLWGSTSSIDLPGFVRDFR